MQYNNKQLPWEFHQQMFKKIKIFYDSHISFKIFTPTLHNIQSSRNACTSLVFMLIIFF
jgi:hypothetical protein